MGVRNAGTVGRGCLSTRLEGWALPARTIWMTMSENTIPYETKNEHNVQ